MILIISAINKVRESTPYIAVMNTALTIAATCGGPIAYAFDVGDKPFKEAIIRGAESESLMYGWQTFFATIGTRIFKKLTPRIPEALVAVPFQTVGSLCHWLSASYQGLNREYSRRNNGASHKKPRQLGALGKFHQKFLKRPFDRVLKFIGIGGKQGSLGRYFTSLAAMFVIPTIGLLGIKEAHYPGLTVDHEESGPKNLLGAFYHAFFGEVSHILSEVIRMASDYKEEFKDNVLAKSITNATNQALFPGALPGTILAAITTYVIPKYLSWVPRSTAAMVGKMPGDLLNRLIHCRRIRHISIKNNGDGSVNPNYRFNNSKGFNQFLDFADKICDPIRNGFIRLVSNIFRVREPELRSSLMDYTSHSRSQIPGRLAAAS